MKRWNGVFAWVAVIGVGFLGGCVDDGSSDGAPPAPTGEEVSEIQKADAGGTPVDETLKIASEMLVEDGSGGASSTKATTEEAAAPSPAFSFQKSVNLTVDLDVLDAQGQDRFPHATGVISVSAAGTLEGGGGAGHVDYSVQVTYVTDAVFTDPVSGGTATVSAGASFSYALAVDWSWTDGYNWSITHASHAQVSGFTLAVACGGDSASVSVEAVRDVSCSIARAVGSFSATWSVTGLKTVTVTYGAETHTVVIDVRSLAEIYVTVDGVRYGPYTAAQLRWICRMNVE